MQYYVSTELHRQGCDGTFHHIRHLRMPKSSMVNYWDLDSPAMNLLNLNQRARSGIRCKVTLHPRFPLKKRGGCRFTYKKNRDWVVWSPFLMKNGEDAGFSKHHHIPYHCLSSNNYFDNYILLITMYANYLTPFKTINLSSFFSVRVLYVVLCNIYHLVWKNWTPVYLKNINVPNTLWKMDPI